MLPADVIWSYSVAGTVLTVGLLVRVRGDWRAAHGLEKLILLGPLFYAAPLAGFGTEHFTLTSSIASIVPPWMPWPRFWAYLVGACFVAAAFSLATGIRARLSAGLLAMTFFLFVILMDAPAWLHHPRDRFALTLVFRELSFGAGALALAVAASPSERDTPAPAMLARSFIALAVLFFALEQFLHGDRVPGIPLRPLTPGYVYGHAVWTYVTAVIYAAAGTLLLAGRSARTAAVALGLTVLIVVLVVYVPIAIVQRASLGNGFNYIADTLMFGGALLMVARAMPAMRRESQAARPAQETA